MPDQDPTSPAALLERALFEVKRVIVGQDRVIERLMVALLARGHCLLEGAPGLAKTLTAETLATVVGGSFVRIQFTPDLVPSDLVGTRIYRPSTERFDVELGPVFANVVLADENPIEHEGVYPLPEAQRDRFLMKILVGYPNAREEADIVRRMGVTPPQPVQVLDPALLESLQQAADQIF